MLLLLGVFDGVKKPDAKAFRLMRVE